jgi:uncharacterized protein YgiM (DUF1202 family)
MKGLPYKLCGFVAITFLISVLYGCKKTEEPKDLPDLNKQTRPYVTVESTRVRTGPGPDFKTIGQIKANSRVHVVGRDSDWVLIVSKKGNAPGYVEMAAVKPSTGDEQESQPQPVQGRYEVLVDTQVRKGPGLHYPVVADVKKGTAINVVDEEKGWYRVESKRGREPGYVEASLARPHK